MNLAQLRAAGAIIAAEPAVVSVTWKESTFDVFVKRLAYGDVERLMNAEGNPGVALIAAAVLLGDEREPITREDAARLDVTLAAQLVEAVNRVNAPEGTNPN